MNAGAVVWEVQNCKASLDNQAAFVQGMYQEMMEFCNCVLESRKPDLGSLEFALKLTRTAEPWLCQTETKSKSYNNVKKSGRMLLIPPDFFLSVTILLFHLTQYPVRS